MPLKLFDLLKDRLKDPKGVISDNEFCAINRRDFLYSETSAVRTFLDMYGAQAASYELRAILDFIHAAVCKSVPRTQVVRVHQMSQSMTLPSLFLSLLMEQRVGSFSVAAPKGLQKVSPRSDLARELLRRFESTLSERVPFTQVGLGENAIDVIFCNASTEADVAAGLRLFANVQRGFILVKGYGRHDAPNCGEIVLSSQINIHCSLAGFGFAAAI